MQPTIAAPARKQLRAGTHRAVSAEETLARITPLYPLFGISRVADLTWLDDIGIPVSQAVRPASWLLTVSQGKGLSAAAATVSAAMESIELWHAERLVGEFRASVGDIEPDAGYRLDQLSMAQRHYLNPAAVLDWTMGRRLDDGQETPLPTAAVSLDGRARRAWMPPLFLSNSNGLASGNTFAEATLHALYELIERDALARGAQPSAGLNLDLATVTGHAAGVLDQFRAAGVSVHVRALPSPTGLPCFRAGIYSQALPTVFGGAGCHLDRDVALCRALTEAAQSRLTEIAGARDDIGAAGYRQAANVLAGRRAAPDLRWAEEGPSIASDDVDTAGTDSLDDDLRLVVRRVVAAIGHAPMVVDLTRSDIGIPVVRAIAPGLLFDPATA